MATVKTFWHFNIGYNFDRMLSKHIFKTYI